MLFTAPTEILNWPAKSLWHLAFDYLFGFSFSSKLKFFLVLQPFFDADLMWTPCLLGVCYFLHDLTIGSFCKLAKKLMNIVLWTLYFCFGCVRFEESSEKSWNLTFFVIESLENLEFEVSINPYLWLQWEAVRQWEAVLAGAVLRVPPTGSFSRI